ncbi:hypothetical protein [Lysinibacillus sp. G4S2]|nr:hypothetical protein [Lysinibacillus sp. G4S2]MDM5248351.1 hypothetical protein [Lysinibacillus sp. G4S2]
MQAQFKIRTHCLSVRKRSANVATAIVLSVRKRSVSNNKCFL